MEPGKPTDPYDHPDTDYPDSEFWGDVKGTVYNEKAREDSNEVTAGSRFSDNGSRIPGRQKARNDTYTEKLKKR
jgi:hypothetical protein